MVVGCQPHTPAAFTPRDTPGTHFHEGNMSLKNPVKRTGIDRATVGIVAQRLNHYATPGVRKINMELNVTSVLFEVNTNGKL
jgi:hypothetical protein